MNRLLHTLGAACAARPWRVVAAWLAVLVAAIALAGTVGGKPYDNYDVPGTRSQAATEFLREQFPEASGDEGRIVLHSMDGGPLSPQIVEQVRDRASRVDGAGTGASVRWSDDQRTAAVSVQYRVGVTSFEGDEAVVALERAAAPARDIGVQVELGGFIVENGIPADSRAEMIGVGVALVVLFLAFGSVLGAGLPLAVALVGLGTGLSGITVLAALTDISTSAPMVAMMVGLGVGIDYALLMATRFVEELRAGADRRLAAASATASAGASVLFAGGTVLVSLLGLGLSGLPVFTSFGIACASVLVFVVLAALTLVPALCAAAGSRLLPRRERKGLPARHPEAVPLAARWARRVTERPALWAAAALAILIALSAPVLGMRTWPQDAGTQPDSNTTRRAYDLVAEAFGPGANGPLMITVDLTRVSAAQLGELEAALTATPGVAGVAAPVLSADGSAAILALEPTTGPQDEASAALVDTLRADVLIDGTDITGTTAVFKDISDMLASRLWLVVGFVVLMSVVLLTVVFRSVVVALKAAAMNLLSVSAAFGVLTVVFQWGWGAELLGLPHAAPVSTWVPILLFAVLFGLSMDYEVFLLSRIRSDYLRTGDTRASVVSGLGATGSVITSAALIMVSVFVGFALGSDVTVKMIGIGMATAIAVDATIVRMVLVPATMHLLGDANWWLPQWLDRILPHLDIEGREPGAVPPPADPDAGTVLDRDLIDA